MKRLLFVLFMTLVATAHAQVKTDLKNLNFMSGTWTGKMDWGELEEYWGEPMGDNMICSFRCVKDGKALFYEFIVIEQSAEGIPVMKLRHFNPGSIAWEDKENPNDYPLVSITHNRAVFESADKKTRLIYERQDKSKLLAVLEQEENGKVTAEQFLYNILIKE